MRKITIIGGGSRNWAITFMRDLALDEGFEGELNLYDIDQEASLNNAEVARRIFTLAGRQDRISCRAQADLGKALDGACFVIISIEPGLTECRYGDLVLPEQYGILQTVGDTTGPGGIMRARRALPLFFDFARQIEKHCPDAWVVNYTNPMTLCTAALYRAFGSIKAFGCCHEVFGTQRYIAGLAEKWFNAPSIERKDIHLDITGINHFTFAAKASWNGIDLMPRLKEHARDPFFLEDHSAIAEERKKSEKWFECDRLVAMAFLRDFEAIGAAGDRHLCEFVPFFLTSEDNIASYGITRTPYQWRIREAARKKDLKFTDSELNKGRSDEEGVAIMNALLGGSSLVTNINFPNHGQAPYLAQGAIAETNALISSSGISPLSAALPSEALQHMIRSVSDEQSLVLDAMWEGDEQKLFQAFVSDPLVRISLKASRRLFDQMLKASEIRY